MQPLRSSGSFKTALFAAALSLAAAPAFAAPVTYRIDPNHTDVVAQWSHFGFSNPIAHFGGADGAIVYDADDVAASSVRVTLPMSGLNSHVEDFDEHLRSDDFFDAANHPEATFRSTAVEPAGEGRLKVAGDLTIKGITRPVVLDATLNAAKPHPMTKREAIGFDATTTLKRSDFDLGMYAPNVSDEVELRITTEAMVPAPEGEAGAE
ncbi:YceI family protein [Luteimonas sp. RD2P54]|uniref:YceI family protein n=1 Tax=Luteimonas endophytica TaxID=3042023 RepID=A0ABT6JDW9_9GAMM|nr:YceI family protein [Luteimonas endophytica]MDH5824929.1 YceI family protein [Luteimonas endophytica]